MKHVQNVLWLALALCLCVACAAAQEAAADETGAVIDALLQNPMQVYGETQDELAANGGEGLLGAPAQPSAEGAVYAAAAGENPMLAFAQPITTAPHMNPEANRAFTLMFKPSAKDFGFMLVSQLNIGLTIGPESEPIVFAMAENYFQPVDTALRIEPGNWYHAVLAISGDGLLRGALWKDGEAESAARFALDLTVYQDEAYIGQPWEMLIGFAGEATLTVREYRYYTFDAYTD